MKRFTVLFLLATCLIFWGGQAAALTLSNEVFAEWDDVSTGDLFLPQNNGDDTHTIYASSYIDLILDPNQTLNFTWSLDTTIDSTLTTDYSDLNFDYTLNWTTDLTGGGGWLVDDDFLVESADTGLNFTDVAESYDFESLALDSSVLVRIGVAMYMETWIPVPPPFGSIQKNPENYGPFDLQDNLYPTASFTVSVVPEPATLLLLGFGMIGLAGARRRMRS